MPSAELRNANYQYETVCETLFTNLRKIDSDSIDQNAGSSGLVMDFRFPASHWKGVAKLSCVTRFL